LVASTVSRGTYEVLIPLLLVDFALVAQLVRARHAFHRFGHTKSMAYLASPDSEMQDEYIDGVRES
jgi:hypothetical protein